MLKKTVPLKMNSLEVYKSVSGIYQSAGFTKLSMYTALIRLWIVRIPLILTIFSIG